MSPVQTVKLAVKFFLTDSSKSSNLKLERVVDILPYTHERLIMETYA